MRKSKSLLTSFGLATAILSPLTIIISCSSNAQSRPESPDNPQPGQPPSAADLAAVKTEVERLNQNENDLLKQTKWNLADVAKWQNNHQSLLEQLQTLKPNEFKYRVISFNLAIEQPNFQQNQANEIEQQAQISFQLRVIKNNAQLETNVFNKQITVVAKQPEPGNPDGPKPFFPNEDGVRNQEQIRLNQLPTKTKLSQTYFKTEEINKLKAKPNLILTKLFGFVPQQYFQYQVKQGSFKIEELPKPDTNASHLVKFKIDARLWRANDPKVLISSPEFSFKILTEDTYQYPEPDNGDYRLEPKKSWESGEVFEINLNGDTKVNLAAFEDEATQVDRIQQLIVSAFQANTSFFFTQTGTLPSSWDWFKQTMVSETNTDTGVLDFVDVANKTLSFDVTVFDAFYPFDQGSDPNDRQAVLSIKFTNMFYDQASKPEVPTELPLEQQFNKFVDEFQKNQMKNQALNEDFIHSGANGVFQFANLTADATNKSGTHFSNFLNFSPTELWKESKFKFKPETIDESINYLTNEIKFKWQISSTDTSLSIAPWISKEQIIKYQPKAPYVSTLDAQASTDPELALANGALNLTGLLDQSLFNPNFVTKDIQSSLLSKLGANWTWKAREFVAYARFTFYQAFGNNASEINYGIENVHTTPNLTDNPNNYQVVLKAKIARNATFAPYFAVVGNLDLGQPRSFKAGDIITIRLNITDVSKNPSVFTDSSEIFPGLGLGHTWGSGEGYENVIRDKPHRTDNFSAQMGTYDTLVQHNNQNILVRNRDVHRFLNLNLLNRYQFNDLFWPEPTEANWASSFPESLWKEIQ